MIDIFELIQPIQPKSAFEFFQIERNIEFSIDDSLID